MKVFKSLSKQEVKRALNKAVRFFMKTNYKKPDKVMVAECFLPRVITPTGEVVDLNKEYADCQMVSSHIGRMPYIPYIVQKGIDESPRLYVHFAETPVEIVADPDDPRRIFLLHPGKMKMTERGLIH